MEMKLTPVAAADGKRAKVMLPLASVRSPGSHRTASRSCSSSMLSSITTSAPAEMASSRLMQPLDLDLYLEQVCA